jgi:hypothetical protein
MPSPEPLSPEQKSFKAAICESVEEFYDTAGREAVGRAIGPFLNSLKITPLELLHSRLYQDTLSDAGTTLMQGVQKAAIAQVRGTGVSVSERVRRLFDLTDQIRAAVRASTDKAPVAALDAGNASEALGYIDGEDEATRRFRIYAALTATLEGTKSWGEKFDRLFEIGQQFAGLDAFLQFDALIAEILRYPGALDEIVGISGMPGNKINGLLRLHDHEAGPSDAPAEPARSRNFYALMFSAKMPQTRAVVLDLALHLVTGKDKLTRDKQSVELDAVIGLAGRLKRKDGWLGGDDTVAALEERCGRLLSDETIDLIMAGVQAQGERLTRALELHERVLGDRARTYLETYVSALMREADVERKLLDGIAAPLDRLTQLGKLHAALAASTIAGRTRERLMLQVEKLQTDQIERDRIWEAIEKRGKNGGDRVLTMLSLITENAFTAGGNVGEARRRAQDMLKRPGFLESFVEGYDDPGARKRRVAELQRQLTAARIA